MSKVTPQEAYAWVSSGDGACGLDPPVAARATGEKGAQAMRSMVMVPLLVAALVAFGCIHTTTTYPDGRVVEVEQIDPYLAEGFISLGQAAIQLAAAKTPEAADVSDDDAPPLAEDLLRVQAIATETQLLMQDGVTADEVARLTELYKETAEIMERQGIRVRMKVK